MNTEYINVKQLCEITGLAKQTVYTLHYKGEIPGVVKFGPRLLRFRKSEILAWMENRSYTPLKEVIARKRAERAQEPERS